MNIYLFYFFFSLNSSNINVTRSLLQAIRSNRILKWFEKLRQQIRNLSNGRLSDNNLNLLQAISYEINEIERITKELIMIQ